MLAKLVQLERVFRKAAEKDFSLLALRVLITAVALVVVILAWSVSNKWILTGVLAYEVLP